MNYTDEFIMHHGVKGQKWGIRRKKKSSNSGKQLPKEVRKINELKEKPIKDLTDQELMYRYQRTRQEMELKRAEKDLNRRVSKQTSDILINGIFKPLLVTGVVGGVASGMNKTIANKIKNKYR